MFRLKIILATLAVAALHLATIPRTIWEYDENLFALAVEKFAPLLHHPPPPGSPLHIAAAKLFALFTDPFHALVAVGVVATLTGFVIWVFAFRAMAGENAALVGALVLYGSPSILVSGMLPQSDAGALALLGAAAWACAVQGVGGRGRGAGARVVGPMGVGPIGPLEPMGPMETAEVNGSVGGVGQGAATPAPSALPPAPSTPAAGNAPWLAALLCALCIGWRLQFSIAVVPMFLGALLLLKSWRSRIMATAVFGVVCLAWMIPLVISTGGPSSYWHWLSGQAAYYAAHDADLSRSGLSSSFIALRFLAHPWGPKWLSLPLLAVAAFGALLAVRKRDACLLPLAAGCLVYLAFAAATMDPADAVRYAIPSLPLIALLAGLPASTRPHGAPGILPGASLVLALLYATGSWWYASPILRARATTDSPPVQAAQWIRANVSRDTILLYDLPLGPHTQFLLREWKAMRVDGGLAAYGDRLDVPLVLYADGEGERTFRWPDTDAYRKLTRQHYSSVSVTPIRRSVRYRAVEGVSAPERTRDGQSWRWLGGRAVLDLPDLGANHVTLVFRAPPEYPLAENRVRVEVHGRTSFITVQRNASSTLELPLPPGAARIIITPEQTFVPANVPGARNRDKRTLSVMLTRVEQSTSP